MAQEFQAVSDDREFLDYELPAHLIAQEPAAHRDGSRLMLLDRRQSGITHHTFRDLTDLLSAGDLLVLNDTRVLPARLRGRREKTGGQWEGLFLRVTPEGLWEMLAQTRSRPEAGERIQIDPGPLRLILRGRIGGHWLAEPDQPGSPEELLARHGHIPLPPYIRKGHASESDSERYQTVFARSEGSVAAPTAGLHFTPRIFEALHNRGIACTYVTLHVGLGTFEPIRTEDPKAHKLHSERACVPQEAAEAINACKTRKGRVIAVGTTVTRTLESAILAGDSKSISAWEGETDLYIYPPYEFRVIDGLLTNFHLPRSTLLLLVAAFAGKCELREAYETAVREAYRFYSYGDAMLIL